MPIYDIFETEKEQAPPQIRPKSGLFSSVAARLFFFVLFIANLLWGFFSLAKLLGFGLFDILFLRKIGWVDRICKKSWLNLKRSAVCGLSLLIALFSPSLGLMIACTYFLMYDKMGIQEVVPGSLQDQFQEFMR
jgi:membrane protease YdiL (CAAX protease family)